MFLILRNEYNFNRQAAVFPGGRPSLSTEFQLGNAGKLEVYIGQVMGNDVEKVNQGLIIKES